MTEWIPKVGDRLKLLRARYENEVAGEGLVTEVFKDLHFRVDYTREKWGYYDPEEAGLFEVIAEQAVEHYEWALVITDRTCSISPGWATGTGHYLSAGRARELAKQMMWIADQIEVKGEAGRGEKDG